MPRPQKCRRICQLPQTLSFLPEQAGAERPAVALTLDEYEAVRLIDREGLSQEQCGAQMQVARTTVQQIYASARRKLADALVEGRPLRIGGGEYRLCDGRDPACGCSNCFQQRLHAQDTKPEEEFPAGGAF